LKFYEDILEEMSGGVFSDSIFTARIFFSILTIRPDLDSSEKEILFTSSLNYLLFRLYNERLK